MNAFRITYALARHFDWFRNRMMPEYSIDGGQADLLFVTKAGYVTEIEIKVTIADWRKDRNKAKWRRPRPHIARFFYAVPAPMVKDGLPDWLPVGAGVLAVHDGAEGYDYVREVRPALRVKAEKLSEIQYRHMLERCYYRFWWDEMRRRGERIRLEKARR